MINRNFVAKTVVLKFLCGIVAVFGICQTIHAQTDNSRNLVTNWGVTTLAPGQTARLNVINTSSADERTARRVKLSFDIYALGGPDTCPGGAIAACTNNLRVVRRESVEKALMPGEGAVLNITASTGIIIIGGKLEELLPAGSPSGIAPTLEILEANRTIFIHPGTAKGFNPQPDPPSAN